MLSPQLAVAASWSLANAWADKQPQQAAEADKTARSFRVKLWETRRRPLLPFLMGGPRIVCLRTLERKSPARQNSHLVVFIFAEFKEGELKNKILFYGCSGEHNSLSASVWNDHSRSDVFLLFEKLSTTCSCKFFLFVERTGFPVFSTHQQVRLTDQFISTGTPDCSCRQKCHRRVTFSEVYFSLDESQCTAEENLQRTTASISGLGFRKAVIRHKNSK